MKAKHPTPYDRGQHKLICEALNVSCDPEAPGPTAYEAVCFLVTQKAEAVLALSKMRTKSARQTLNVLQLEPQQATFIRCYGAGDAATKST